MASRLRPTLFLASLSAASAWAATTTSPSLSAPACATSMNGQLPSSTPSDFHFSGNVRNYYIAAEEIEWNFAPTGWDNWLGVPINLSPRAMPETTYNTTYLKALYRGYTDSSFTTRTQQPPWQGTQGPTIRSEVGDMVQILFCNMLTENYATMHSMGLAYNKYNEGSDYPGNPMPGQNSTLPPGGAVSPGHHGVPPGSCVVYKWLTSDIAGPNDGQPARVHQSCEHISRPR